MKKFITVLMAMTVAALPLATTAMGINDEAKKEKTDSSSTSKKDKNLYQKTFIKDKSCVTAKCDDGFMTLHKVNKKLYIELPKSYLGKEMLIASTISQVSDPNLGSTGYKPQAPMHVKFELGDSTTVYMEEVSQLPDFNTEDIHMAKAVELNGMAPIIGTYAVFCETPDNSGIVFEMTKLFTGNDDNLAPVRSGSSGGVNMTATFNAGASTLGDIKAFKDNVSIKSTLSYTVSANLLGLVALKNKDPFSVCVTRTILLLPEKKMQPRIADSRVGIFLSTRSTLISEKAGVDTYSVIHKWDVQPSDSAAYRRGELVEPTKHIVFYMDDAFPAEWREPAKKGILRWNTAFEKIGLKNVIQIKDFPTPEEDPEFDPDNLKYSCIRYVPAMISNAMGPSWVDPSTGEIINASIIVYNDVIKLAENWRFCQTAQVDERVRGKRLPKDVLEESIEYIIAHEAGHCLGFMHNMAASAAFPTDSLRSRTFTSKYGTTPSIMDYARFNYVAQPEDKGARLTPPFLGVYDEFLVKYAYTPLLDADGMEGEKATLEGWVDSHAGDPLYRYGRQQVIHRYDPSAIEEDLGDDPVKSGGYGAANIKYIMSHLNEWVTDEMDPDGSLRESRYEALAKQYNRYLNNAIMNIGGIYLNVVKPGTPGKNALAVPVDMQRKSLKWVIDQLKDCGWVNDRSLTDMFPLRVDLEPIFQYYTALDLFGTYANVILSAHVKDANGESYTMQNWLDDIYEWVWKGTENRKNLTRGERILQNLYISAALRGATKSTTLVKAKSIAFADDPYLPSVEQLALYGLDPSGMAEKYLGILKDYEAEYGKGSVAASMLDTNFGESGYNWQYRVNTRTLDESKALFHEDLTRIAKFLKANISGAKGETKAHYRSLLKQIESSI